MGVANQEKNMSNHQPHSGPYGPPSKIFRYVLRGCRIGIRHSFLWGEILRNMQQNVASPMVVWRFSLFGSIMYISANVVVPSIGTSLPRCNICSRKSCSMYMGLYFFQFTTRKIHSRPEQFFYILCYFFYCILMDISTCIFLSFFFNSDDFKHGTYKKQLCYIFRAINLMRVLEG